MTSRFTELLSLKRTLLLDGAMGTLFQAAGMPAGVSPSQYSLERPDLLLSFHRAYIEAGADIVTTNTFGANPFKLEAGLDLEDFNRRMARIAREAASQAGRNVLVAGNVGPTGHFAKPLGDVDPAELVACFERQIRALTAEGLVDLIFIETQFDVTEARAAAAAARRVCSLPVMCSMTFEQGASLTGSTPALFAETMQNMGCAVVGTNCSLGPAEMAPVAEEILRYASDCLVMAEPNAGLPELVDGKTVFPLGPERFAELTAPMAAKGCRIVGGCCGTTPDHIRALKKAVEAQAQGAELVPPERHAGIVLTSRQRLVRIGTGEPFTVIGERINPTGKPKLTAELQQGVFSLALEYAERQIEAGCQVLDVNVGAHQVDQKTLLPRLLATLAGKFPVPLCLDSSDDAAIEQGVLWSPASALVNSINGAEGRMARLGALCRDFGCPFILLPMRGAKLPVKAKDRIAILESLLAEAEHLGIPRRLVLVDILALAVSSKHEGAVECLALAEWCREAGLATTIGLSNLSFGLPARELVNATFLCMGAGAGLNSCIGNLVSPRIAEAVGAIKVLQNHDPAAGEFIAGFSDWKSQGGSEQPGRAREERSGARTPYEAVLHGDREHVEALLDEELAKGTRPFDIVNSSLIPAITEVGSRYEKKIYFLPQLIRSAETMQAGFAHLKPLMKQDASEKRPVIVMATVEGDIHDIGKNIVCLLLGNHGFEVVDAGKDVKARDIVDLAEARHASVIGLSALMTTTMVRMEETISLLKERGLAIPVMVGGAAVTKAFADAIGADAYCVDAVEAVDAAKRLTA
jgi:5-methyltetrahydrofolate--homocysteine methyltransferase